MNKLKESTIKIIKRTIGSFFLVGLILSLISYLSVSQGNTFAFGNIVAIIFICAILGIPTYFLLYKDLKEKNVASIDEYLQKIEDLKNQIKELFIKNNKLTTTNSTLTKRVYALASEDMQSKGNVNDTSTDPLNNYIELSSQNSTNVEEILPNSQIHRTSKDESLSLSFFTNHEKIIYDYENKLLKSIEIYTLEEDIDKQIELCKNAISIFKRFRDFCYRTKGGTIYFQDTWEYYYNSHNGYSSYIDSTIKRLKYLQDNYNMLKNMKQIIIDTIKNNSGILQKNIYALIDINFKNEIQYAIRQLEDEQIIKRTKKGVTYLLEIIDKDYTLPVISEINNNFSNSIDLPDLNMTSTVSFIPKLNIPDEIINLLWIKGGPLHNYYHNNFKGFDINGIKVFMSTQEEPSLIDVSLPIDSDITSDDYMEDIGYYPSYKKLTPKQRYVYLSWLQDISKPVAIGYVFIFYYGLERHLMFGKYKDAIKIINYLQHYHNNNSFFSYSCDAMLISVLKNNNLSYIPAINVENASNAIYALVKGFLYGKYFVDDIIRLHKEFGFTNNRYIKKQYDDFAHAVKYILIEKYHSDFYPLPEKAFSDCDANLIMIVANYSLIEKDRFASAPDITTNNQVKNDIYKILVNAHEKVKSDNRKRKR